MLDSARTIIGAIEHAQSVPVGTLHVRSRGFLTTRYDLISGNRIFGTINNPFFAEPSIDCADGTKYSIQGSPKYSCRSVSNANAVSQLIYEASCESDASPIISICHELSGRRYSLTGHLDENCNSTDAVVCVLRSEQPAFRILDIWLMDKVIRVKRSADLDLVAFSFFLSLDYLYYVLVPCWPAGWI